MGGLGATHVMRGRRFYQDAVSFCSRFGGQLSGCTGMATAVRTARAGICFSIWCSDGLGTHVYTSPRFSAHRRLSVPSRNQHRGAGNLNMSMKCRRSLLFSRAPPPPPLSLLLLLLTPALGVNAARRSSKTRTKWRFVLLCA